MKRDCFSLGLFLLLLFFTISLSGCWSNLPKDLPKLYPCKVTVLIGGQPVEGVNVTLSPSDGSKWSAGGKTDATGTVSVNTSGMYPGAAAGEYNVMLYKVDVKIVNEFTPPQEFPVIKPEYNTAKTTPLTYTMEAKASETTFDLPK